MWKLFFRENPYTNFPLERYARDVQGWGDPHPVFPMVLTRLRPKVILEVGVWKGYSTLHMAHILQAESIPGHIIAIDTWLGSLEHHLDDEMYALMSVRQGIPDLYNQFLANVLHENQQDRITPLPQTSDTAFRLLRERGVVADCVYVDGDHEYSAVARDIAHYWELLRPGGVLIGDDYVWPGVLRAVDEFSATSGIKLYASDGKYLMEKP